MGLALCAAVALSLRADHARADEGGAGFWLPGLVARTTLDAINMGKTSFDQEVVAGNIKIEANAKKTGSCSASSTGSRATSTSSRPDAGGSPEVR